MKNLLVLLLGAVGVVSNNCCNGRFGKRVNTIDWSQYVLDVKNQGARPLCWAYAAASYLEMEYAHFTGIYHSFSAPQIGEHAYEEQTIPLPICYNADVTLQGGHPVCGLDYVNKMGVMTELNYQKYGYNVGKVIPVTVTGIKSVINPSYKTFLSLLNQHPLILSYDRTDVSFIYDDIVPGKISTHAVVGTNLCLNNGDTYIEFLNSYGSQWGECDGYGYIRVTDGTQDFINNRNILSGINYATIDTHIRVYPNSDYSNIILLVVVVTVIIAIGALITASTAIITIFKMRTTDPLDRMERMDRTERTEQMDPIEPSSPMRSSTPPYI
jgi:hypothetical protein